MTGLTQYVFDFLKLTPRYFITLGGAATFLLFGPERFTKRIGVYDFTQNNRQVIGLVFVLSSVLLVMTITIGVGNWVKRLWRKRKFENRLIERLHLLTENEKQILLFYIAKQTKSSILRIDDGIVKGLESAGIIYRAASVGSLADGFAYNIDDLAWCYLNENKHLLSGVTSFYGPDKPCRW